RLAGGDPGALREDESGWRLERIIADGEAGLEVESLFIPKRAFDDWWAEAGPALAIRMRDEPPAANDYHLPAAAAAATAGCSASMPSPGRPAVSSSVPAGGGDEWAGGSRLNSLPFKSQEHSALWTGSEMIVWGGFNVFTLNSGARYNPATDAWTPTSTGANVPTTRRYHTAVWTGSEMIIWGGLTLANNVTTARNTGGRYNPASDSWLPTSTGANVPSTRYFHTGIWTGSEMIVWGGIAGIRVNTGGRYNPSTDSWTATATTAGVPSTRSQATAVWTGTDMIVWGGVTVPGT